MPTVGLIRATTIEPMILATLTDVGNAIISEAYFPASEDASMERLRYFHLFCSKALVLLIFFIIKNVQFWSLFCLKIWTLLAYT